MDTIGESNMKKHLRKIMCLLSLSFVTLSGCDWETVKETATNTWNTVSDTATDVWGNITDTTTQVVDKIKEYAEPVIDNITTGAKFANWFLNFIGILGY